MNELNAGYEFTKAQIAELESLRAWKAEIEKQAPVCWMTPSGEGWMMRTEPPVTDTKLGWTAMFTAPVVIPDVAEKYNWLQEQHLKVIAENQSLKSELCQISDALNDPADNLTKTTSECIQSLKTELVNWKSRCEHRVADIQLQAKRVVDLEATMRSLNTELEAALKDAERLDYIQQHGSTIELVGVPLHFRIGGIYSTARRMVREAIDAAIEQAKGGV